MIIDVNNIKKKEFDYIYNLAIIYLIKTDLYNHELIKINKDDNFLFEIVFDNKILDIYKGYSRISNMPSVLKSNISKGINIGWHPKSKNKIEYLRIDYNNLLENINFDKYEAKIINKFLKQNYSKDMKKIKNLLKLYNQIKDNISNNRLDLYLNNLHLNSLEGLLRTYLD